MRTLKWNSALELPELSSPIVIVCGSGMSALELFNHPAYGELQVMGVNDACRMNPTWMITSDGTRKVKRVAPERYQIMMDFPKDRHWSLNPEWGIPLNRQITPGSRDPSLPNIDNPYVLDFSFTTTITACGLMQKAGARVIGVIGLDMTPGHFFNPESGNHGLSPSLHALEAHLFEMNKIFSGRGIIMRNLSPISRLQSLQRQSLDDFIQEFVEPLKYK